MQLQRGLGILAPHVITAETDGKRADAATANEMGFIVPDYNYDPRIAGIAKPNGLVVKQPFTPEVPQSFNAELVTQKDRLVYSY